MPAAARKAGDPVIFGVIYDQPLLMSPAAMAAKLGADGLQPAHRLFSTLPLRIVAKPHLARPRQDGRPAIGAKYGGTLTAVRFRHQQNRLAEAAALSIGQGSGALATASDLVFHGEPDGNSRPMRQDRRAAVHGRPAPAPMRPRSPTRSTATQYVAIAAGGVSIQTTSANAT